MTADTTAGAAGRDADALVHTDLTDGVFTVTLDSPSNRNALSRALTSQLAAAIEAAVEARPRTVVLTHTGPVFCAGADLKERASDDSPADPAPMVQAMRTLMDAPFVSIAALKGPVRAGGVGLMASCDLVVCADETSFAFTEVRIGVAPAIIAVPILRRCPASLLRTAFLTGAVFDTTDAVAWGLITHAVPADAVDSTVAQLCAAVRAGSPIAVAATKRLMGRVTQLDIDAAFTEMVDLSTGLFDGADAAAGMAAFANKQTPTWGSSSPTPDDVPGVDGGSA